jgi:murein DD-endopeptidase
MRTRQPFLRNSRPKRKVPVLPILLGLSVLANAFFVWQWQPKPGDDRLTEAVKEVAGQPEGPADPTPAEPTPTPEPATPEVITGARLAKVTIKGAVARDFSQQLGKEDGNRLAITAGRLYSWWLDVTSDPRKGDTTAVLYEPDEYNVAEVLVHALNYRSQKMGKVFEAFRFQPGGWAHATWFDADGQEVPASIAPPPIRAYEQITALVGDGRKHGGMDFKTPVGTEVLAPWDGTIARVNWNLRYNGNSIEMNSKGRKLRYLHLSETGVKAGAKVKAGQVIGLSGNTGRSFAPHLHYEIVDGSGKTKDPLKVHDLARRSVPAADRAAFDAEVVRLRAALAAELAEVITPATDATPAAEATPAAQPTPVEAPAGG